MKKLTRIIAFVILLSLVSFPVQPNASAQSSEWATYRGTNFVRYGDGAMYIDGDSSVSSVYYTGEKYTYYEMTADITVVSQTSSGVSSGIVYRTHENTQGLYLQKTGTPTNPRALKYMTNTSYSSGNDAIRSTDYTKFDIGEMVNIKTVVSSINNKDVISVWTKVYGVDTDYRMVFENETLSTEVSNSGYVGFFLSKGSVKIENVTINNTITNELKTFNFDIIPPTFDSGSVIIDQAGTLSEYSGSYISLDGSSAAALNNSFAQMPDTFEAWFRTETTALQPIIDNYRNATIETNPYRLQITAQGNVRYYEMNEDTAFSLVSQRSYCNGEWYRTAVTRTYDNVSESMMVTLYMFDNKGGLLEKVWQTLTLSQRKVEDYAANGHFSNRTPSYIGSDWFHGSTFKGCIGEISLWDRPLSQEELTASHVQNTKAEGLMYQLAYYEMPKSKTVIDKVGGALYAQFSNIWVNDVTFYGGDYSILVLPDTQRLVKYFPAQVDELFTWIADNANTLGIKLVLSLGDLVNDTTAQQYSVISNAANRIYGKVPFLILDGNHDYNSGSRDIALFKTTFNPDKWRIQTGYTGSYEDGTMSNSYYTYEFGDNKYIFLMLEVAPRDVVITWANEILKTYSDHTAIVATHAYLDVSGTYLDKDDKYSSYVASNYTKDSDTDAKKLWNNLISKHKNIQMVFSGHMGSCDIIMRSDLGDQGNIVHTFNMDAEKMDSDMGGIGAVALFNFSNEGKKVAVNYYSVSTNRLIGSNNQFVFALDSPASYVGCQDGSGNIRLVASVDSTKHSEIGFDAVICNLSNGAIREESISTKEIYTSIKSNPNSDTSAISFNKDYLAAIQLDLPEGDSMMIVTPFSITYGVRTEGQSIIITRVNGQIHQERFFG